MAVIYSICMLQNNNLHVKYITVTVKKQPTSQDMNCHRYIINFDIKDLKSFKRSKPNLGWSYIIFILKDGTTYPALHFHKGGTKNFIEQLKHYMVIKK